MREINNSFLQVNPHIKKMLQNDIQLKYIGTPTELRTNIAKIRQLSVPVFLPREESTFFVDYTTVENYTHVLVYMVLNNLLKYNVVCESCYFDVVAADELLRRVEKAYTIISAKYVEYFAIFSGIKVQLHSKTLNNMVVGFTLSIVLVEHYVGAYAELVDTFKGAMYVRALLYNAHKLNVKQSEYEKMRILYNWTVLHSQYDKTYNIKSYTGFSVLYNGVGVCQGFTAIYNLLCKLEGINIVGMAGKKKEKDGRSSENHIWSYALSCGKTIFVDVTWGCPIFENTEELLKNGVNSRDLCNFEYFDIPVVKLQEEHIWDRGLYG